ncbi:lytic transglycosylase catalytic [Candidatus Moduliflexus flocculans]|uniref:Lytic transglycosylase catalytic n=1 Tax=Candidatus Moduliflexus flocculans TaxID=1499966 RepID=A0A0S6VTG9_9BACT|nr:lytic transglycosylase catalytic [Candidatus Moduliflexus flocculans]
MIRQHVRIVVLTTTALLLAFLTFPPPGNPATEQKMLEDVTKLLLGEIGKLSTRIAFLEQQNKTMSRALAKLQEDIDSGKFVLPDQVQDHMAKMYTLPKVVSLCDTRVPLDKWDVWQRLDSEFFSFLVDQRQIILWLKRTGQFFPYIEEELEKADLPDDLKYVTIIESGLRAGVTSNAGAAGYWQFIESTGNNYGLTQNAWLDNRRDLYASTQAALKYLGKLYKMFNDWPLALAAYNCGEGRVMNAMKSQGVNNYYQLELPRETERYVFRVIAAKIILSDPKRYGFYIDKENLFPPYQFETVTVTLKQETNLRDIARKYGSYFREIRLLNPEIQGETLPAGTHTIKVPKGWQKLVKSLPKEEPAEVVAEVEQREDGMVYTVRKGDSIGKIANQFDVPVGKIKMLNGKTSSLSEIHPGDQLLIEK